LLELQNKIIVITHKTLSHNTFLGISIGNLLATQKNNGNTAFTNEALNNAEANQQ
jgi:hypothetical protein